MIRKGGWHEAADGPERKANAMVPEVRSFGHGIPPGESRVDHPMLNYFRCVDGHVERYPEFRTELYLERPNALCRLVERSGS